MGGQIQTKIIVGKTMIRVETINCIGSLSMIFLFLDFINARNEILECTIRDGTSVINLKLREREPLLVNENLPVWIVRRRNEQQSSEGGSIEHELKLNIVQNEIGEFVFYHDKEKSAAVVLHKRTNTLFGLIDTRYTIHHLPLDYCKTGVEVGGEYVNFMNCETMNPVEHLKVLDLSNYRNEEFQENNDVFMNSAVVENLVTNLYPEIMVFIPYDIVSFAREKHPTNYLAVIIASQIMLFNAIDMLFSKLSTRTIKIHINLAGFVFEDEENMFDFMLPSDRYIGSINVQATLASFAVYTSKYHDIYHEYAFDFFFISTSKSLWHDETNAEVSGLSIQWDAYTMRKLKSTLRIWPGSIAHYSCGFEYIAAAHEIAHLLRINHDPLDKGCHDDTMQCYAIMQEINKMCPDCLKWSEESIEDLKIYATYNPDRCFLLNRPRSLYPYGSRVINLLPSEQCLCYGFEHQPLLHRGMKFDLVSRDGCGHELICGPDSVGQNLPLPMDGTPCLGNRVCWAGMCQPIHYGL